MGKRTPLYDAHIRAGATMIDFSGWDMPIHYGSQIQEHLYVREDVGVFDVSHMTVVDVHGPDVQSFLRYLFANNIDSLKLSGKALYTCMLNENGGVFDDMVIYRLGDGSYYRIVMNCATHDKDLDWLQSHANEYAVEIKALHNYVILSIQGPHAIERAIQSMSPEQAQVIKTLKPFYCVEVDQLFISRTGYTGEDGIEVIIPADKAVDFWNRLLANGVHPCGIGARDTLRLEAGYNLYGTDMDETVTPLESNLTWTVSFEPNDRNFIGRNALEEQIREGVKLKLVGLVLLGRGVLRNHQKVVIEGFDDGEITSGGFSPILQRGIAMARVPVGIGGQCQIEVKDQLHPAQVIELPFIKDGKANFELIPIEEKQ